MVQFLLQQAFDVNHVEAQASISPLICAIIHSEFDIAKSLLVEGADVECEWEGYTPLAYLLDAVVFSAAEATWITQAFVDAGAPLDTCSVEGIALLHLAASIGHLPSLDLLVNRGADINLQIHSAANINALSIALAQGHIQACKVLTENGAVFKPEILQLLQAVVEGLVDEVYAGPLEIGNPGKRSTGGHQYCINSWTTY